eukprot:TRINITY_DN1888_c0_g1_i1.p1 TRINITY_DN1888_c0_g1~~TRINITY_DN1888_c0_g1_i1.p1  ORF type:complete len:240 (-),score=44.54 TRINITY_DN1888_c0_g1_i1:31-750(-)
MDKNIKPKKTKKNKKVFEINKKIKQGKYSKKKTKMIETTFVLEDKNELEYFEELNIKITDNDVTKVSFLFWSNILFTIIGFVIYWYAWPIAAVMMVTVSIFLLKKVKHTKMPGILINASVFGILSALTAMIGFIFILSIRNKTNTFLNIFTTYSIFTPIAIVFCIVYMILSSMSLLDLKSRYDRCLTQMLVREIQNQSKLEESINEMNNAEEMIGVKEDKYEETSEDLEFTDYINQKSK